MSADVIVVGGGLAGSTLSAVLARQGRSVLMIERETKFKDRVRGESMLPWGVAAARRLNVFDDLVVAGAHRVPFFNTYAMGTMTEHRPLPETTPTSDGCLHMYHPDLQETLVATAVKAGAQCIGINNRDLRTFTVDRELAIRLRPSIPADRIVVAESGIRNGADVARLRDAGVDAILVGETLMRAHDPAAVLRGLLAG